jgi:hypothetical protein
VIVIQAYPFFLYFRGGGSCFLISEDRYTKQSKNNIYAMKTKEKEIEDLDDKMINYCIYTTYLNNFENFEKVSKEKVLMIVYDKTKVVTLWDKDRIIPECTHFGIMHSLEHNDNLNRIMNGAILILKNDDNNPEVIILKLDIAKDLYYETQRSLKLKNLKNKIGLKS